MKLSNLPQEIVETLAEYLTLSDLVACTKVNHDWRNAFNYNRIWKRFCSFHPNYFLCQESKVGCSISGDLNVSEAKQNLSKEQYVKRNFVQGIYHVAEVEIGSVYCDNILDWIDEVGNHWLFVSCTKNSDFESEHVLMVWDLKGDPSLHTSEETPLGKVSRILGSKMKMSRDKLFYLLNKVVLVYRFSHPEYKLTFLQKIELDQYLHNLEKIFEATEMVWCNHMIFGFCYTNRHMGIKEPPFVCVWNEEGSLLYQNFDPNVSVHSMGAVSETPSLSVKSSSSNILVAYSETKSQYERNMVLQIFNTLTFEYKLLDFIQDLVDFWIENNIITVVEYFRACFGDLVKIQIFSSDGRKKKSVEWDYSYHSPHSDLLVTFGNRGKDLVILSYYGVTVFDTSQVDRPTEIKSERVKEMIEDINRRPISEFKIGLGGVREKKANIFDNNILLLQYSKKNKVKQEVWNYKSGEKLYNLDTGSALGFAQSFQIYSFIESYNIPAKLVALKDPETSYAHVSNTKKTRIAIISFW